jgi:hypothetical protein
MGVPKTPSDQPRQVIELTRSEIRPSLVPKSDDSGTLLPECFAPRRASFARFGAFGSKRLCTCCSRVRIVQRNSRPRGIIAGKKSCRLRSAWSNLAAATTKRKIRAKANGPHGRVHNRGVWCKGKTEAGESGRDQPARRSVTSAVRAIACRFRDALQVAGRRWGGGPAELSSDFPLGRSGPSNEQMGDPALA